MTGALETILSLTVRYAQERVQVGRPIGEFQAIQQQISVLASHVAAAVAAAQGAIDRAARSDADFEIAAAKTRIGEAAGISAVIAHQVHGAMGFTHEHSLQLSTRRLWAWRDEFGSEAEWAEWIGRAVARVGGSGLWPHRQPHLKAQSRFDDFAVRGGNTTMTLQLRLAAALSSGILLASPAALAQAAIDFVGKSITINIGFGAGGSYDFFGRLAARHLGKHLKGNPTVIPQNMPGAGGFTGGELYL